MSEPNVNAIPTTRATHHSRTHKLTVTAMLSTVAFLLMFIEFPIPALIPAFVKLDISDLPELLAAFSLGPIYGVIVTLLISLIGLVGYTNNEIQRRSKEIAIRKVNGATARDIQRLILHDLSVITLPAILLGITSAYLFSREWLMRFNDRITLHWWIFAVGALFVAVIVACVALWQPHRSAHGDPIKMIRTE